jgi:hypothetical protein
MQLSTSKGNPINITSAQFTVTGSNTSSATGHLNNTYATLYVDGVAVASKTVDAATVKFDSFSAQVTTSKSVNMQVKVDFSDAFAGGNVQFSLAAAGLTAVDSSSSRDVTGYSTPDGAIFTIQQADAIFALSDSNPQAQLFLA